MNLEFEQNYELPTRGRNAILGSGEKQKTTEHDASRIDGSQTARWFRLIFTMSHQQLIVEDQGGNTHMDPLKQLVGSIFVYIWRDCIKIIEK